MNGCYLMPGAEFYVAVDNVCAWPNLTLLPNGEIAAAIYNKPSHGFGCGNIELWVSEDDGRMWKYRSTVSDHSDDPKHVRMNHAVGLNIQGHIVALVSGYGEGRVLPYLDVQVCLSKDQGRTWERSIWEGAEIVPFGNIVLHPDGTLTGALYGQSTSGETEGHRVVCTYRSKDDGRSWGDSKRMAVDRNETALLRCRSGKWLAAARSDSPPSISLLLLASSDEAQTWQRVGRVTNHAQQPGHLLELHDGRIVLTYGSRAVAFFGAGARISEDQGATWSGSRPLVSTPGRTDCGYPSSVELKDGTIVSAYYAGAREKGYTDPGDEGYGDPEKGYGGWAAMPHSFPWHQRYHMGVCRWRPEMLAQPYDEYYRDDISRRL